MRFITINGFTDCKDKRKNYILQYTVENMYEATFSDAR